MAILFEDFLMTVPPEHQIFVLSFNSKMEELGCGLEIKEAKSGYVLSYKCNKKTAFNWVFRKSGMLARIYGDNIKSYSALIPELPEAMQKHMKKSSNCRRLLDPSACSPHCSMGLIYELDGEVYKKCRFNALFFPLTDESAEHIEKLAIAEILQRNS